jgi:hypothetical protein
MKDRNRFGVLLVLAMVLNPVMFADETAGEGVATTDTPENPETAAHDESTGDPETDTAGEGDGQAAEDNGGGPAGDAE